MSQQLHISYIFKGPVSDDLNDVLFMKLQMKHHEMQEAWVHFESSTSSQLYFKC